MHCVKSVQIRSYFWSVFCCIRAEYRKIQTRNKSVFGHFSCSAGLSRYYSSITLLTECYKLGCHLLDFILGRNIKAEVNERSKRTRIVFSSEVEDFIIQSVRKFWCWPMGQNFDFHPSRASASIKDKYRTMKRQGIF